jgi:hypothetical protein
MKTPPIIKAMTHFLITIPSPVPLATGRTVGAVPTIFVFVVITKGGRGRSVIDVEVEFDVAVVAGPGLNGRETVGAEVVDEEEIGVVVEVEL